MRKNIYIFSVLIIAALILFNSCKKEEAFNYNLPEIAQADIDSINLSLNHFVLVADGVATLKLKLQSYTKTSEKIEVKDKDAEMRYTYNPVFNKDLPKDAIKYFSINSANETVELSSELYIAALGSKIEKMRFFAKCFDKSTDTLSVDILNPLEDSEFFAAKRIPVVFHIIEPKSKKNTEFVLQKEHIHAAIDKLNNAFCRKTSIGPSSCNTKVEFYLVDKDPSGKILKDAGINMCYINKDNVEEEYSQSVLEAKFLNKYKSNLEYLNYFKEKNLDWDNTKYMNIWIIPTSYNPATYYYRPGFIVEGQTKLAGMYPKIKTDAIEYTAYDLGIIIKYNNFLSTSLNNIVGQFLGLKDTAVNPMAPQRDSDYCNDTFMYVEARGTEPLIKTDVSRKMSFVSDNLMDIGGQSNSISVEQAYRIHHTLNYCPVRMMWKK